MLELAQTVIRVAGSSSEITFEALPYDYRRPAGTAARHHARARECSAGSPRSTSRKACALAGGARAGTDACIGGS